MIIYIDKSIAKHGDFTDDEEVMFTALACAHRKGDCYLCGADESIKRLKDSFGIYGKGIGTQHAEEGALIDAVETLIVITYDESPVLPQRIRNKPSKDVRIIPIAQAVKYRLSEPCILLGESLYDCDFYRLVMRWYMHSIRKSIKGVWPQLVDEQGNGESTNKSLEKCVDANHNLTICLTDSDKKYDCSPRYGAPPATGKTMRDLKQSEDNLLGAGLGVLFELYCLDVHEAENLIPFCVLDDIAKDTVREMAPGITYLRKLQKAGLTDAILLYDFKKGNNIDTIRKDIEDKGKTEKRPVLAYWEIIAHEIGDESAPSLNKNVLSKAITQMQQTGYVESDKFVLDDHLVGIWNDIGRKVFSWGCANMPNATKPAHC